MGSEGLDPVSYTALLPSPRHRQKVQTNLLSKVCLLDGQLFNLVDEGNGLLC